MSAVTEKGGNKVIALGRYDGHGAWEKHHSLLFHRKLHSFTNFALDFSRKDTYCAAFHDSCGKLLKRELEYKLHFEDLWSLLLMRQEYGNVILAQKYEGIKKYHGLASFDFEACAADGNTWMLQDPLICRQNAERILEVWRPLVRQFPNRSFLLP
jgi:hypothetical protein